MSERSARHQHEKVTKKDEKPMINRRIFLKTVGVVGVAAAVAGFGIRKALEDTSGKDRPEITSDDSVEIQIRRFENANQLKGLEDDDFRNKYVWLLAQWYAQFTPRTFADPSNPYAAAEKIYKSTFYITDPKDENLKGNEENAGWAQSGENIFINLTQKQFSEQGINPQASVTPPIILLRDVLTHEMTHFITLKRTDSKSLKVLGKSMGKNFAYINGFRLYVDDYNDEYADFDESVTEFIANYYQRISGFAVGLPSYPDFAQSEAKKSKVEKIIDTLDATLKFAGINVDQLALLHATSDLDGLAIAFANATTRTFKDGDEKLNYGLSIIQALRETDNKTLGKYIGEIKR